MSAVNWRFVLTDAAYRPVGELLNAYERRVAKPLSKLDTMSFRLRLDNPLASPIMACDGYIKAYRGDRLMFYGPVISAEATASDGNPSVAVNAVGAGWFLSKRFAGKSATGTVFGTLTDRAVVVKSLIDTANAEAIVGLPAGSAETGIATFGPLESASRVLYTAGPYKTIMDIMVELASAYDGFEWRFDPIDNFDEGAVTGNKIANLVTAARPMGFGDFREEAVFEWGVGRNNMKSFKQTVTRDTQANRMYHNVSTGPDSPGYPTLNALNLTSISNYRLLEDLAQVDLTDAGLRQQFVDESVRIRAFPRQIIEFVPHIDPDLSGRVPQYGVDYDVGDLVRARAVFGGRVVFDAWFRLWGMSFEISDMGVETGSMALAEEAS